jgi:hypothetical protein
MAPITPRTAPAEMTFSSAARAASENGTMLDAQQSRPAAATARTFATDRAVVSPTTHTSASVPTDRDCM